MDWKKIRDFLKNSGLLLAVFGAITSASWKALGLGWNWLCSLFMTTVEVDKSSYLYDVLEEWLGNHPSAKKSTRFRAETIDPDDDDDDAVEMLRRVLSDKIGSNPNNKQTVSVVTMTPSQPLRCFLHNGHWIQVKYSSEVVKGASSRRDAELKEKIELSTFGRDRTIAKKILQEAVNLYELSSQDAQRIYVSRSRNWSKIARKRMRPPESVVLEGALLEDLIKDAKDFETDFEWYQKQGVPHRRGYLLEGPPGTGKSSLIQAICGKLEKDIYYLKLAADDMSDDALEELVMEVPHDAALVIEDVDAAFHGRVSQQAARGKSFGLTFSGLLNILDGIAATEGRLLFMTTNHIERLDPALIRPGRVDRIVSFSYATEKQIMRRFEAFFPFLEDKYGREVSQAITPLNVTMAEVQQYLLLFRHNGEMAHANRMRFRELATNAAELFSDKFTPGPISNSGEVVPSMNSMEIRMSRIKQDTENSMECSRSDRSAGLKALARRMTGNRPISYGRASNSVSSVYDELDSGSKKNRRRR